MFMVPKALLLFGCLVWTREQYLHDGVLSFCGAAHSGYLMASWKVAVFYGLLGAPLLGLGRLIYLMIVRIHMPSFRARLNVEGTIVVVLSVLALGTLMALLESARVWC